MFISILNVLLFVFCILCVIGVVELYLYFNLVWFRKRFFWPVSLLLNFGVPAVLYPFLDNMTLSMILFFMLALTLSFKFIIRGKYKYPIMLIAPGFIGMALLIFYPFYFEVKLAFTNLNLYTVRTWLNTGEMKFVGFRNFINVFTSSPLQDTSFWMLVGRTILWTGINVFFHVLGGMVLALLLNNIVRFRGIYRTILIIPWAIPQVIAVLAWKGEFHGQYGFINLMLGKLGIEAIPWSTDPFWVFTMVCIVNIWLGIPFMMVVILGGLQSIPRSYYEAAKIDGASALQSFKNITLPLLKPVLVPAVTLGTIWTFNNINVIYLMTGQGGGTEYADILVSALYKAAFTYNRYSFSAAFALVIFVILILLTLAWIKISKGLEDVRY